MKSPKWPSIVELLGPLWMAVLNDAEPGKHMFFARRVY